MIVHEAENKEDFYTIVLVNGYAMFSIYQEECDEPGVAWLANVRVHPSFRGQGIGNTLIRTAISFAREKGYTKLQLAAKPGWVVDWYKRMGFSIIKENYCGRVIMEQAL